MNLFRLFSFSFLFILAITHSFKASAAAGFDVNDSVFLFPLDGNKKPFPDISLGDSAAGGKLLYFSVMDQIIAEAKRNALRMRSGVSFDKASDWKVVAFRYDPCSPDNQGPTPGECTQEIRVVAQPISASGPEDTALHMIYLLGRGEPRADNAALKDLIYVKNETFNRTQKKTAAMPLGIHPGLRYAQQNPGKGAALPIIDFLRKYAKPASLRRLTIMGLKNASPQSWTFIGGDVVNGQWRRTTIANLPHPEDYRVEFDLNSSDRLFFPVPENKHLSTYGFFHRETLGGGEIDIFRQNIHLIENPRQTNRNTVDCLSCHTATSIRLDPNQFVPKNVPGKTMELFSRITGFPAAGLSQRHRLHWNLRSLGYFGVAPSVSQRLVNEAAWVARRINKILSLDGPGKDCSARRTEVQTCFDTKVPTSSLSSDQITAECLKMCQP